MNKKTVISVNDVSFSYGDVPVLDNVSLNILENDFLGIIGPNGGGKTTLLKIMLGLIKPQRGNVEILGLPVEEGRKKAGYVPQYGNYDRDFPISVIDVVLSGMLNSKTLVTPYSKKDIDSAMEAMKTVELLDHKDKQFGSLSEGLKQRTLIARALAGSPGILILDEPTASVDTVMQKSIYELLKNLTKTMAVVMVTHDIGAVSGYVEKIACLNVNLFYHDSKEISSEMLEKVYHCPVDLIAHGLPHRVLKEHKH